MSGGSPRRYSAEQQQIAHDRNLLNIENDQEANLLRRPLIQRALTEPNYELFGFVYKIRAYDFVQNKTNDLKHLKKVELIYRDPHNMLNDGPESNVLYGSDGQPIDLSKITVFTIPDITGT